MNVLKRWKNVRAVRVESEFDRSMRNLDDTSFDIVLELEDGSEVVLAVDGGNGGAYGACLSVRESADTTA